MADLFYYEAGYIDEKYFTYVANAEGQLTNYIDSGYIDLDYYYSQGTQATLTCDATKTSGQTVEALGSWTSSFTQSATALRTAPTSASFTVTVDQSTTGSRIVGMAAAFDAAWTSSLTAIAYKNHDAHLASTFTISVDAVVNRSANVLLEHIADLNAMAAKTAVFDSALTITSTQTSSATTLSNASASLSTTATISVEISNVQYLEATTLSTSSSIFTSRYLGIGRPRNLAAFLGTLTYSSSIKKFGTHSLTGSTATTLLENSYTRPKQTDQFSMEGWIYYTGGANGRFSTDWLIVDTTGSNSISVYSKYFDNTDYVAATNIGVLNLNQWNHIVVSKNSSRFSVFVNGSRAYSITSMPSKAFRNVGQVSVYGYNNYLDNVSLVVGTTYFDPSATTITVPTSARTNDPVYTRFLYNFDNNLLDDIGISQTGSATLTLDATISAQANNNTKSASADLSTASTLSSTIQKFQTADSGLSSESTLTAVIGTLENAGTTLSVSTAVTADNLRVRYFAASEYSAFESSITAKATKVGDIDLSSEFTLSAQVSSFTDASADLTSAFNQTATAYASQKASASLSASVSLTSNSGKLKSFAAAIDSALSFSVTATAFEGTDIAFTATSSLTVSGKRLRFGQANPTATFTQTADVRANLADWDIGDYEIFCSGFIFDSETKFSSNVPDSYQDLIDVAIPFATTTPSALTSTAFYAAGIFLSNGQGTDTIFAPVHYLKRVGTNSYEVWALERQHSYSLASDTNNLSTNTWRSTSLSTSNISQSTGNFTITLGYDGNKGTTYTAGKVSGPHTLRILGNPNYAMFVSRWDLTPPANSTTLRNVSFTPTGTKYAIPYPTVTGADLKSLDSTLTAEALNVILFSANLTTSATQSASAIKTSRASAGLTANATVSVSPGFRASALAGLSTTATVSASAIRPRLVQASLSTTATLAATVTRRRSLSSTQSAEFTQSATAVKKTGNIVNLESAFSQTTTGIRVRYASAEFSAFYSNLTAAFKNATGTVLLETTSTLTANAVKNGDLPATLTAEFTQTAELRKIVGFSSNLSSDTTVYADGQRIQPAGAELSTAFTLTATTTNSKITRVTSNQTATATLSATVRRIRGTIALELGQFTLTCNNQVLRLAQANLSDSFSVLASPTFIIRVTVELTGFYSSITVGDVINIDPFLKLTIEPEGRGLIILPENRIIAIEQETRVNII